MNALIKNSVNETIDYLFKPGRKTLRVPDWVVVLGHGVTGDRERPVITDTADALQSAGFDTLAFSFAGNGASDGDFQEATITKEVEDLDAVITALAKTYPNIVYLGHSMGGAVGALQAARDQRLSALISVAGMVNTRTFAETEFGDLTPDEGFMWDEEDCPLSQRFMDDLCETIGSVLPAAEVVAIPWLLLHGTADDVVLPRDSEAVKSLPSSRADLCLIDGADHSFNEPPHKSALTRKIVDWVKALAEG